MLMVKAYAKVNVALNVNEKLENGYHDIDTVILPLELHDRIEFEILPNNFDTMITSDDRSLPTDESNLIYKAYKVLKERYNFNTKFRIHAHKCIPVSAGLAGGSADAAATLNTLIKMLKIKISKEELIELAKKVGSDVPYCLFNKPSRCKGIGENLEHIKVKNKYYVLLIKPKQGMSTAEAYRNYDNLENKEYSDIDLLLEGLAKGDDEIVAKEMKNGLELPTKQAVKEIDEIKNKLIEDGFNMSLMSGSGSKVIALSTSLKHIQKEASKFDAKKYYVKVTNIL